MNVLERLRDGLVVSVQANADSLLNTPATIALLARCVVANGAVGVRVEGLERVRAVRVAVEVPIIGLVKRRRPGFEPYITTTTTDVEALVAAGADLVAVDATPRPREGGATLPELVAAIRARGRLALADCATAADARAASAAAADAVATTLAGYTAETAGCLLPALELVTASAAEHSFVVCEGGIATPQEARAAFAAGASAIVVGTAITNVDLLARRFVTATPRHAIT